MQRYTPVVLGGLLAALAACADERSAPLAPDAAQDALLARGANSVQDQYIVVLKRGASPRAAAAAVGASPRFVYEAALNGFAARLNASQLAALRNHPHVDYVEPDGVVTLASTTQWYPTWGLDRIDQRNRPLNNAYTYNRTGAGVNVYVLDTGIRYSHTEFGGRASAGYDAFGGNASDCNGHGTHVAGTVGGATYGVAKGANLISVRVLDCGGSGTWSGVIAGVDWVTVNRVGLSVANMSLGGGAHQALDQAVTNSINSGVTYVVAAGNNGANACNYSPARVSTALTVGNSNSSDQRSSTSNFGSCVNLFAPGTNITSAWHGSDTQTHTISGTSMASPHVAGVAAMYLEYNPGAQPVDVRYAILTETTRGVLSSIGSGSPNYLLFSGFIPSAGGGGNPGPSAPSISVTCEPSMGYCEASAWGGSGAGYSFTWSGASEEYDEGGYSYAYPDCGWSSNFISVSATVTDSNGGTATGFANYYCGGNGGPIP